MILLHVADAALYALAAWTVWPVHESREGTRGALPSRMLVS